MTKDRFVSADRTYDIECKSSGSKPAAVITWWRNNKQLKKFTKNVSITLNNSFLTQYALNIAITAGLSILPLFL